MIWCAVGVRAFALPEMPLSADELCLHPKNEMLVSVIPHLYTFAWGSIMWFDGSSISFDSGNTTQCSRLRMYGNVFAPGFVNGLVARVLSTCTLLE